MSDGDASTDGDSINARNPSSTGMGCFKNYEHAQRNRVYSSQVSICIQQIRTKSICVPKILEQAFLSFLIAIPCFRHNNRSYRYRIQTK